MKMKTIKSMQSTDIPDHLLEEVRVLSEKLAFAMLIPFERRYDKAT